MELRQIKVYDYDELSDNAKENALNNHINHYDFPFLEESLREELKEELKKSNIKCLDKFKLRYSLSYSQGDGLSFVGNFEYKEIEFYIREGNLSNHYSHSQTVDIDYDNLEDENTEDITEEITEILNKEREGIYEEFKELYESICSKIEKKGYEYIEYKNSEENFKDLCEINEYKFTENGELF